MPLLKNESGLTQLITMGESIRQIWVNQTNLFQYQWCPPPAQEDLTTPTSTTDQQRHLHTSEQGYCDDVENCRAFHHMGVSVLVYHCTFN